MEFSLDKKYNLIMFYLKYKYKSCKFSDDPIELNTEIS